MLPAPQGESERSFAENSAKLTRAALVHQFGEDRARIEAIDIKGNPDLLRKLIHDFKRGRGPVDSIKTATGEIAVMVGHREVVTKDPQLIRRLQRAAH